MYYVALPYITQQRDTTPINAPTVYKTNMEKGGISKGREREASYTQNREKVGQLRCKTLRTSQVRVEVCKESSCIVGSQLSSHTSLQQVIRQLVKIFINTQK
jgi:hypothetical protein